MADTPNNTYATTWGTPLGQDCISLDSALCRWLAERLLFLSRHANAAPYGYADSGEDIDLALSSWQHDLRSHAETLKAWADRYDNDLDTKQELLAYAAAQDALRWVADNLGHLWD